MKFTAPRNELAIAVTHAVHGVPNNPVQPVYAGMMITALNNRLRFVAANGDVAFTATTNIISHGTVVVPGKLFADVIRALPDLPVDFSSDDVKATLTCGRGKFQFPVYKADYPFIPAPAGPVGYIDSGVLADAVKKVIVACAKTDANPALQGIFLDPDGDVLWAVATDRYRLAAMRCEWTPAGATAGALIPGWAADRFTRGAEDTVSLGWDDRVLTMHADSLTVTARAMQGQFPKWRTLLPSQPCTVAVDTAELSAALKRAQLAAEPTDPVSLTFTAGQLHVEAGQGNHADDVLPAKYDGSVYRGLFGISMLADGLAGCGDTCHFGWTDSKLFIQSGGYSYTLQPRRKL